MNKKCYKIPAHTRRGRPVASHIRCRTFEEKKEEDASPLEYKDYKLIHEKTKDVLKIADDMGYVSTLSQSQTRYGKSEYVYIGPNNQDYSLEHFLKVRISDHESTSWDRIINEVQLSSKTKFKKEDIDFLKKSIQFKFEREKHFKIKTYEEKYTSSKFLTEKIEPYHTVVEEFTTKKGKLMYWVISERVRQQKAWFDNSGKYYTAAI